MKKRRFKGLLVASVLLAGPVYALERIEKEPPLSIGVSTRPVFSGNYKHYAGAPFGEITLKNNAGRILSAVRITIGIRDVTDYPTLVEVGDLPEAVTVVKPLTAAFNSSVLDITEDGFIESEIKASYFDGAVEKSMVVTQPVYVYEKHALTWDDKGKIAFFITPRDPVVGGFSVKAVEAFPTARLNKNLAKAMAVFEAMGSLGIEYMEDPGSPYSVASALKDAVDHVQFPRETLVRKAGDRDDLTALFASALSFLGVRVKILDSPGDIYLMFDTQEPAGSVLFGFPEDLYTIEGGNIYLPVDTTLVGMPFRDAWEKGAENFRKERPAIIDVVEAWKLFRTPELPPAIFKEEIKTALKPEKLEKERISFMEKELSALGSYGLMKLMEIYSMEGLFEEAGKVGERLLKEGRNHATLNNIGNVHYLKGDFDSASLYYAEASLGDPGDAEVLVNLSRAYLKKGEKARALSAFEKALARDEKIKDIYAILYRELIRGRGP
jgi:tetratricopeptide (TPR) repeat protein